MKLAVIIGCDSGIGMSLCRKFIQSGYTLFISYLEKNPFDTNTQVIAVRLDLRNE